MVRDGYEPSLPNPFHIVDKFCGYVDKSCVTHPLKDFD